MTVPVSGWSVCRVGLAPTGKRRLVGCPFSPAAATQPHQPRRVGVPPLGGTCDDLSASAHSMPSVDRASKPDPLMRNISACYGADRHPGSCLFTACAPGHGDHAYTGHIAVRPVEAECDGIARADEGYWNNGGHCFQSKPQMSAADCGTHLPTYQVLCQDG